MKQLDQIAMGTLKLDAGEEVAEARPGQILTNTAPKQFGRDNLGGF